MGNIIFIKSFTLSELEPLLAPSISLGQVS
jgi:hypothetical protein